MGISARRDQKFMRRSTPSASSWPRKVTAANEQERAQVADLAKQVQLATRDIVKTAFADRAYARDQPSTYAAQNRIDLVVLKLADARKSFALLPRRWVVEVSFALAARFRRPSRDYECLPISLAGLHWLAILSFMLNSMFRQSS